METISRTIGWNRREHVSEESPVSLLDYALLYVNLRKVLRASGFLGTLNPSSLFRDRRLESDRTMCSNTHPNVCLELGFRNNFWRKELGEESFPIGCWEGRIMAQSFLTNLLQLA
ncbi:hypothetical protein TNCV_575051 [Trichonephila clavipes]|nr:hypothetical protein TNCV_575051 [Trichonephila clavipes]